MFLSFSPKEDGTTSESILTTTEDSIQGPMVPNRPSTSSKVDTIRKASANTALIPTPYTFGHFFGMPIKGEKIRLVHQWIRYSSGAIPGLEGRLIGPNSLGNKVHALRMETRGSTFSTVEEDKPLQTGDKWFRPIHCAVGPDGAIYVADFYDARITHVDPRDNWDRSNGRIHRIRALGSQPWKPVNLGKIPSTELVNILFEGNQWARRHARRILAERGELPTLYLLKYALVRHPGSDGGRRYKSLEA